MTVPHSVQEASYPIARPVVMGNTFGIYLMGLLSVLAIQHFRTEAWERAGKAHRGVVSAVIFLTMLYSALTVHDLWFYGTITTDNVGPLLTGTVAATIEPFLAGLIAACVQTTLAIRGSRVVATPLRRWVYLSLMGFFIVLSFVGSILATVWSVHYHFGGGSDGYLRIDFPTTLSLWMWSSAFADAVISGSYTIHLLRRIRSSNKVAASALKLIIPIVLQSALYTALFALVSAIMSQSFTLGGKFNENCIPYAFWLPLAQLYAISLFTTLGAADKVTATLGQRKQLDGIRAGSGGMGSLGVVPVIVSDAGSTYAFEVDVEGGSKTASAMGEEAKK
ncbi:hypothetical protein BCR35DRAFT_301656 [Leucosporidium creatinivorum]|uniref:Proteophosphoglycan ppg4 n=1 Tax=Leucosporidium creatinivorum TaxID=106004 RepID=A0A1Y2FWX8_9BASI|nr:hypothetical protein BCR35DRAFT_301656 [Leucosporidium creatinivorum]